MNIYQFVPDGEQVSIPLQLNQYRCVILIEREVAPTFRQSLSRELVDSGCLYSMAWGIDCFLWDESVDWAVFEKFGKEIPRDQFVMTTWHEGQPLEDVLFYAKFNAMISYADVELEDLFIIDLGKKDREHEIWDTYSRVR